jgi:isopentenyl-diphosphate delta-isomerase
VVENELCPVYRVNWTGEPTLNPDEVASYHWLPWPVDFPDLSPWCVLQLDELAHLGPTPRDWPTANPTGLPPAARA